MRQVLILALLTLAGCGDSKMDMEKRAEVGTVIVSWVRAVPKECGPLRPNEHAMGCTSRAANHSFCTITMAEDSPDWVIAHEFKHCFGYEHRDG